MGYSNFVNGFKVTTRSSIDKRIILTKEEMRQVSSGSTYLVPEIYFALCSDDNRFYLYTKQDTLRPYDPETGYYHPIDEFIDFTSSLAASANFKKALDNSDTIENIDTVLYGDASTGESGLIEDVSTLQEDVQNIKINGGIVGE